MDIEEFRTYGKQMIDYICEFRKNIADRKVHPGVHPDYLAKLLPEEAPEESEEWPKIMEDTENHIMSGITQWQHPKFFAYFPHGASFPSLLGDMFSDAIGVVPFSWTASPACSELEVIIMDWICKALGLPEHFLSTSKGGGCIQTSASEGVFNCVVAARTRGIKKLSIYDESIHPSVFLPKLVAYCSEESHSCIEKAVKLAMIKIHILTTNDEYKLTGEIVKQAIEEDMAEGLTPVFLATTFGTTSSTAMDKFDEIGPICEKYGIWLHIDGAYAGTSLICPEIRKYAKGFEYADSFDTNACKWFLIHADCALLWIRDREEYCSNFIINPLYLEMGEVGLKFDYRHWGIPLTRRFRSIKLWFTIRSYGLSRMREYQRNHMRLAKYFEEQITQDERFEVCNDVVFGLVAFRLVNSTNKTNQDLLRKLNESGEVHMVPTMLKEKYVIRFVVTNENAVKEDIDSALRAIKDQVSTLLEDPDKGKCPCRSRLNYSFVKVLPKSEYDPGRRTTVYDLVSPILFVEGEDDKVV